MCVLLDVEDRSMWLQPYLTARKQPEEASLAVCRGVSLLFKKASIVPLPGCSDVGHVRVVT